MPRKAPNEVFEHRITFGQYERDTIQEALTDIRTQQYMKATGSLLAPFGEAFAYVALGTGLAVGLNTMQGGDINQTLNQMFPEGGKRFLNDNFFTNSVTSFIDSMENFLFPNRD